MKTLSLALLVLSALCARSEARDRTVRTGGTRLGPTVTGPQTNHTNLAGAALVNLHRDVGPGQNVGLDQTGTLRQMQVEDLQDRAARGVGPYGEQLDVSLQRPGQTGLGDFNQILKASQDKALLETGRSARTDATEAGMISEANPQHVGRIYDRDREAVQNAAAMRGGAGAGPSAAVKGSMGQGVVSTVGMAEKFANSELHHAGVALLKGEIGKAATHAMNAISNAEAADAEITKAVKEEKLDARSAGEMRQALSAALGARADSAATALVRQAMAEQSAGNKADAAVLLGARGGLASLQRLTGFPSEEQGAAARAAVLGAKPNVTARELAQIVFDRKSATPMKLGDLSIGTIPDLAKSMKTDPKVIDNAGMGVPETEEAPSTLASATKSMFEKRGALRAAVFAARTVARDMIEYGKDVSGSRGRAVDSLRRAPTAAEKALMDRYAGSADFVFLDLSGPAASKLIESGLLGASTPNQAAFTRKLTLRQQRLLDGILARALKSGRPLVYGDARDGGTLRVLTATQGRHTVTAADLPRLIADLGGAETPAVSAGQAVDLAAQKDSGSLVIGAMVDGRLVPAPVAGR